jgi:hypothetical protein
MRSRQRQLNKIVISLILGASGMSLGGFAYAGPACGPEVKEEIVKIMVNSGADKLPDDQRLRLEAELYQKYQSCGVPDTAATLSPEAANCGKTAYRGSLWWEEISCCGYDPQRRMFGCPVTVKQSYGYGPNPLPGSREYVLNCVWNGAAYVPVANDSVHLANSPGQNPPWQFAVLAMANTNINLVQPMNGITRLARSILSWQLQPTNCNYRPIWGNVIDYRIRLDQ